MFQVKFSSVADVLSFVEQFGSTAGLYKMRAIDLESLEYVDQAVSWSKSGNELKTLSDTFCDNNGHRQVDLVCENILDPFDVKTCKVITHSCYGKHEESFVDYLKDLGSEKGCDLILEVMGIYDLQQKAVKLKDMIR